MKKGIVMLLTLALVMILTLAVLKSTTTTQSYLNDMSETIYNAQFNRSFLDMTNIIKQATQEIKNADMFSVLLKMPLVLSDEKSQLESVLNMSSAAGKININQLVDIENNNTVNQKLYDVFYSMLRDYRVSDSLYLLSLILDSIDTDDEQRAFDSELAYIDGLDVSDGGITNKKAFKKILDYYAKIRKDTTVYEIPWDDIITFSGTQIDYNYLNSKIKAILERDYGINIPFENVMIKDEKDLSLDDDQKELLKDLHVKFYVPRLLCNFEFFYMDKSMSIKFIYDLKLRRISDIETTF